MTDILDAEAVAGLLKCAPDTVVKRTLDGTLPGVKFGHDWMYPRAALMEALCTLALTGWKRAEPPPPNPAPTPASVARQSRRRAAPTLPTLP